jgi:Spy/CpxP family protein refolding chaperone
MRTLSAMLTLVLATSVGTTVGAANGLKGASEEDKPQVVLVVQIQDLNLTDQQEAKIADIRKEFRPKVQEAAKELGALVREELEKVTALLTAEQKQKIQGLREDREERREECLAHAIASLKELDLTDAEMTKIAEIRREYRPRTDKVVGELAGLLTEPQKKARDEALSAGKRRREVLEALKLTDQQKERFVTVAREMGTLVREEVEKIRDVLTEGQQEKLQELRDERKERVRDRMAHRIANLPDLNLTDEQKTKLATIRQEFRPKVHEAGNKLRAAIREEVEMIVAVIKG